jgi:hypothetical protein
MGGPSSSSLNNQSAITQQQMQLSQSEFAQSEQDYQNRLKLQQPAISMLTAETTGSPADALKYNAPMLSNISQAKTNAAEQINEQVAPGAAREVAQAQNIQGANNASASTLNNIYSGAFDKLANIGAGIGSFSLQEAGAAIQGGQAASNSNQVNIQAGEQQKASLLGTLGSVTGAAGTAYAG